MSVHANHTLAKTKQRDTAHAHAIPWSCLSKLRSSGDDVIAHAPKCALQERTFSNAGDSPVPPGGFPTSSTVPIELEVCGQSKTPSEQDTPSRAGGERGERLTGREEGGRITYCQDTPSTPVAKGAAMALPFAVAEASTTNRPSLKGEGTHSKEKFNVTSHTRPNSAR